MACEDLRHVCGKCGFCWPERSAYDELTFENVRLRDELAAERRRTDALVVGVKNAPGRLPSYIQQPLDAIEQARAPTGTLKEIYVRVMGPMDFEAPEAKFVLRVWDGMDGCWTDCSADGDADTVLRAWAEKTENGTKKVSYNEIDYYRIFPADTTMHWSGEEGREMFR